jgi:zinc/manganese transport system substrate-binding protein/manganese/iron transport system substrate-binding protein
MRWFAAFALPFLFLSLACRDESNGGSGKLRVVATTTQIGDFARNVGGNRISLTLLLKPNQDAHDFEPQPSQMRAISEADLIVRNGAGLDAFLDKSLSESKAKVIDLSGGLTLLEGHEEHEGEAAEGEEEEEGKDPHIWFSVANAKRMVETLRDALAGADAANAAYYGDNAAKYLASLDALDAKIKSDVATIPAACRKLVTNHDVLGYYANAYGLEIVGAVIPSTSTEAQPSAADIADIVRKIKAEKVPAIFAEASVNPALIRQVGREAGVKVVADLYGDSLGPATSDGATYIKMMESNTRKIVEALRGC